MDRLHRYPYWLGQQRAQGAAIAQPGTAEIRGRRGRPQRTSGRRPRARGDQPAIPLWSGQRRIGVVVGIPGHGQAAAAGGAAGNLRGALRLDQPAGRARRHAHAGHAVLHAAEGGQAVLRAGAAGAMGNRAPARRTGQSAERWGRQVLWQARVRRFHRAATPAGKDDGGGGDDRLGQRMAAFRLRRGHGGADRKGELAPTDALDASLRRGAEGELPAHRRGPVATGPGPASEAPGDQAGGEEGLRVGVCGGDGRGAQRRRAGGVAEATGDLEGHRGLADSRLDPRACDPSRLRPLCRRPRADAGQRGAGLGTDASETQSAGGRMDVAGPRLRDLDPGADAEAEAAPGRPRSGHDHSAAGERSACRRRGAA